MIRTTRRAALEISIISVLASLVLMIAGTASAAEISIAVGAPESVAVGEIVEVKAVLTSAGEPVDGGTVSLTYGASLAGFDGRVELDRETTGADGIALLTYEQRAADNDEMRVEYLDPEDTVASSFGFTIAVQAGAEQQHRSEAGVSIWWLNGWIVIAVIMIVWGLIVYAAFQLVIVGRSTGDEASEVPVAAGIRDETGSAWISVVLAVVTVITAVGMVIVFVRNPLTHTNLDDPGSYDRTPIARVGEDFPYLGPGLEDPSLADSGDPSRDGRVIYFEYGCAGCHGLAGDGGVVAPELLGEVGSQGGFAEDVREGPDNMPGYEPNVLSDERLAEIHSFLRDSESD